MGVAMGLEVDTDKYLSPVWKQDENNRKCLLRVKRKQEVCVSKASGTVQLLPLQKYTTLPQNMFKTDVK